VELDTPSGVVTLANDDVVIRIGGNPPTDFLDRIGVSRIVKEIAANSSAGGIA